MHGHGRHDIMQSTLNVQAPALPGY